MADPGGAPPHPPTQLVRILSFSHTFFPQSATSDISAPPPIWLVPLTGNPGYAPDYYANYKIARKTKYVLSIFQQRLFHTCYETLPMPIFTISKRRSNHRRKMGGIHKIRLDAIYSVRSYIFTANTKINIDGSDSNKIFLLTSGHLLSSIV